MNQKEFDFHSSIKLCLGEWNPFFIARTNSSLSRGWDYCHRCERSFVDRRALEQHWTYSFLHWWCHRCDELFDTKGDLENHKKYSTDHWVCEKCGVDYAYEGDLEEHYHEDSNHNYCTCCSRDFASQNNLNQVKQSYSETSRPMFINVTKFSMKSPIYRGTSLVSHVETTVISQRGQPCSFIWKTAVAPPSNSWIELLERASSRNIMFNLSTKIILWMIVLFHGRRHLDVLAARELSRC